MMDKFQNFRKKFKRWRMSRPFWGATFSLLAGLIILYMPIHLLEVALRPGNFVVLGLLFGGTNDDYRNSELFLYKIKHYFWYYYDLFIYCIDFRCPRGIIRRYIIGDYRWLIIIVMESCRSTGERGR